MNPFKADRGGVPDSMGIGFHREAARVESMPALYEEASGLAFRILDNRADAEEGMWP